MLFFSSGAENSQESISPEKMGVYDEINSLKEKDKNSLHKFTEKTILYVSKAEAEFGKDVPIESGIKSAAEDVFSKRDEIHEKINSLMDLTHEYEDHVINCYKKNDLDCLVKTYEDYNTNFLKNFNQVDALSRERGREMFRKGPIQKVLNAVKQVKIDFLEYKDNVELDLWDIKKILKGQKTSSYIH